MNGPGGVMLAALSLEDPRWLLLLPVIACAWILRTRRAPPAVAFAAGARGLPVGPRARLARVPEWIDLAALAALGLALCGPQRTRLVPAKRPGIEILLCLDTSSSMGERDLDPTRTRLEVAKEAAASFVEARRDDRIGLLSFARYPDVACPLTRDHGALLEALRGVSLVDPDGPEEGTGIGGAVARAAQILSRQSSPTRVVVLLSDGEENVALLGRDDEIGPLRAARLCEELSVRVYAIAAGLGRPSRDGGFEPIDTRPVRELAERTGGAFFEARDAGALGRVYREIARLERGPIPDPRMERTERSLPFVLVGLALLVAARALRVSALEVLP